MVKNMDNKKITIKDVAKKSGVSVSTVSRILNGYEQNFTPRTVRRVLKARDELSYEPDYFARRMIMKESKTIGVLIPDITNPFFSELIRGIENILYKENFITMLCNADLDQEKEDAYLRELTRRGVDGFIIASSAISNESINATLKANGHPFIVLDQKKAEGISDAIITDDYTGGQLAAQHLKELGHEQIAIAMPKNAPANIQKRLSGVRSIYGEEQIDLVDAELSKTGGRAAVPAVLKTKATAIFAINDEIALGLYLGLSEAGKKIPADYSVIGYDNIDMCEYMVPQLTTIAQPIFELGQITAKMLLERIENPSKDWEERMLPVNLIERFSTAHLN